MVSFKIAIVAALSLIGIITPSLAAPSRTALRSANRAVEALYPRGSANPSCGQCADQPGNTVASCCQIGFIACCGDSGSGGGGGGCVGSNCDHPAPGDPNPGSNPDPGTGDDGGDD